MDTNCLKLLQNAFTDACDISGFTEEKEGVISLRDDKTCIESSRMLSCDYDCDKTLLFIESDTPLTIVNFDKWRFTGVGKKCDYLVFDSSEDRKRFALCELTCTMSKYVDDHGFLGRIGKRATAREQMRQVWHSIINNFNPALCVYIEQYREKSAIFGWRERNINNYNKAIRSMQGFSHAPGSSSKVKMFEELDFDGGFQFIQVKYPAKFHW
jgi:hypothetical protein